MVKTPSMPNCTFQMLISSKSIFIYYDVDNDAFLYEVGMSIMLQEGKHSGLTGPNPNEINAAYALCSLEMDIVHDDQGS